MVTITLIALASASGTAIAAPTTTTIHEHGVVETFVDLVPSCDEEDSPLYEITTTSNRVNHETVFADGRVHATFTDTGTFVAEPLDASLPSYTGKFTIRGGFNANNRSVNGTFTFNVHGTGSDGSILRVHFLDHFNARPNGTVQEFFKCH